MRKKSAGSNEKNQGFFFVLFLQSKGGKNTTTFSRRRVGRTRVLKKISFFNQPQNAQNLSLPPPARTDISVRDACIHRVNVYARTRTTVTTPRESHSVSGLPPSPPLGEFPTQCKSTRTCHIKTMEPAPNVSHAHNETGVSRGELALLKGKHGFFSSDKTNIVSIERTLTFKLPIHLKKYF